MFLSNLSASISNAITSVLEKKARQAAEEQKLTRIVVAGGVSANSMLRAKLSRLCARKGWELFIPKPVFCTDNAAMIGVLASFYLEMGTSDPLDMVPFASYPFAAR